MSRALRGLYKRFTVSGEYTWYIDKCIKRVGRRSLISEWGRYRYFIED
jgi:hypothetical protein